MDVSLNQYGGWEAKIMYQYTGGELIDGVEFVKHQTGTRTKLVLKKHNQDDNCILFYINDNGFVNLQFYDISEIDNVKKIINESKTESKKHDYIDINILKY